MPVIAKAIYVVIPVFSVIAAGYAFASFKKISLEPIIELLLYVTIPALVISSLSRKPLVPADLLTVAGGAVFVVAATGVAAYVFLRVAARPELRGFYLPTMFMNSGNMSFPLALLAFGQEGLTAAILYYIAISLLVYSLGIYIAKGGTAGVAEIFKLPLIYASAAGIALNLSGAAIPGPLLTACDMLGAATIPIMQVALGYRLHSARLSHAGMSAAGSVIRIGGGFAAAVFITWLFGIEGLNAKIIILSSAMPSAVINFVVSHRYNVHSDLVASTVAASTILSVVTTPLVLMWLM